MRSTFPEEDARAVALALALDEVDRAGELVDGDTRRRITREALDAEGPEGDAWLATRARALEEHLRAAVPGLDAVLEASAPRPSAVPWVVVAVVFGLATNALGPERAVSVLAPPLLGLILWNLLVYAGLAVRRLVGALGPELALGDGDRGDHPGLFARLRERLLGAARARRRLGDDTLAARLVERYLAHWRPGAAPLVSTRVGRVLHLAAATAVAGTVAGLYLRGLATEYRATWESTFLGDAAVDAVIGFVLAPAEALLAPLGVTVPPASTLRAPETGPAAPWIHLWATTAMLFVIVPRLALATAEGARVLRLRRRVPVEIPRAHRQRLLASASTEEHSVDVLPYSFRPVEKALQALRRHLLDLVGARARVRVAPTLDYGVEPSELVDSIDRRAGLRVVLFGLAQTPELEVHGDLLRALGDDLADGQRMLVVVDESSFRRKLGEGDVAARLDGRRRAWRRVVEDAGLDPAFVDLVAGDADAVFLELERVLGGTLGEGGAP